MTQLITPQTLQQSVAEWSVANFDDQKGVNQLAPLLGIFEEVLDELFSATTQLERADALGDICIYLCDFSSRDTPPCNLFKLWYESEMIVTIFGQQYAKDELTKLMGKLAHVCLKRHQGIRGYDDDIKYAMERNEILMKINIFAPIVAGLPPGGLMKYGCQTFTEVVSKRGWTTLPQGPNSGK